MTLIKGDQFCVPRCRRRFLDAKLSLTLVAFSGAGRQTLTTNIRTVITPRAREKSVLQRHHWTSMIRWVCRVLYVRVCWVPPHPPLSWYWGLTVVWPASSQTPISWEMTELWPCLVWKKKSKNFWKIGLADKNCNNCRGKNAPRAG